MQVLDGTIVLMSVAEMLLTYLMHGSGYNLSFLRMLRMLRVLRILRLMRSWRGLYKIITTFLRAIPQMANVFILILEHVHVFPTGHAALWRLFTPSNGYSSNRALVALAPMI